MRSTTSLDDLLEGICRRVTTVMEADAFFIALYDRESRQLDYRIHEDRGVRHAPERRKASGLTARLIDEQKVLLVTNFESGDGPKASLGAPMVASDEILGVIVLQRYDAASYSPVDQTILTSIADEAAALIDKACLVEDLNRAYNDLRSMQTQILQSRNTLRALFDNLADSLYIVDQHYQILAVNQAHAARVGGPPQSLVGRTCHLTFYGEEQPCDGSWRRAPFARVAATPSRSARSGAAGAWSWRLPPIR